MDTEGLIRKIFLAPAAMKIPIGTLQIIERPGWFQVFDPENPAPESNEIICSAIAEADAERVIDETIAHYRRFRHPVKWCVGPLTQPANTGELLARRGFRSWEVRGMYCNPQKLHLRIPAEVTMERLTLENLEPFVDAQIQSFGVASEDFAKTRERFLHSFRTYLPQVSDRFFFYLARWKGEPAGTAGCGLGADFAYMFGAQVSEAFRGRGLYKALIEGRLSDLRKKGVSLAVTQAREATSAPILERVGYQTAYRSKCYLLDADAALLSP